jgi:cobalt-zinc-cadmium efflux system outer membrane protein
MIDAPRRSPGFGQARRKAAWAPGALLVLALAPPSLPLCQDAAPSPSVPESLQEVERRALAASPLLKAADARIEQQQGLLRQAGLYPNPELSLDVTRFAGGFAPRETTLAIRQPFPWHGKRGLDRKAAMERLEAARSDRERDRLDVLLQVREAFARVYFAAKEVSLKEEDLEAARSIEKAVELRVSAGDAAPMESLRASVERMRADSQMVLARGELAAEAAGLNLIQGLPADAPVDLADPGAELGPAGSLPELQEIALRGQPDVQSREHAARAAAFEADRARLERRPDLAVGPTLGDDQGRNYLGAGVAVRLPIWNRNQGNIEAAEAGRRTGEAEAEAARIAARRLVADAYNRYHVAQAQHQLYEQGLLARAAELVETARKSYEGGESGILDLLDARRSALAVREEYYRSGLDAALAAARLRRAAGLDRAEGAPASP